MRRRAIVIAGGVVLVILAALLIRGCLDARKDRAFADWVREASSLIDESGQESETLFELLNNPDDLTAVEFQNNVNSLAIDAERLVERAEATDAPDELAEARDLVIQTLELRQDGLDRIAEEIPAALGDEQREEALEAIATDMRTLLASDVIYARQAAPLIEEELERQELADEVDELPRGRFLPGLRWLEPDSVGEALDNIATSESETGQDATTEDGVAPTEEGGTEVAP